MRDVFDDDDLVATPTLTAAQVEGWDSLTHVRLMLAVQRAFKVKFAAAELSSFKNVGDLARLIALKAAV
jgi:acyl carrier protein